MQLQQKLIDVGLGAAHLKNAKAPSSIFSRRCSWESLLSKWQISAACQIKKYSTIAILRWN